MAFWYPTAAGLKQLMAFTLPELGESAEVVLEGTLSPKLQALLIDSERRGLSPRDPTDEAGCAEKVKLLRP